MPCSPPTVPTSESRGRSGSRGGGGGGAGRACTTGAAATGGAGGRRDAEKIGRSRVTVSELSGTAHKGLPARTGGAALAGSGVAAAGSGDCRRGGGGRRVEAERGRPRHGAQAGIDRELGRRRRRQGARQDANKPPTSAAPASERPMALPQPHHFAPCH